MVFTTDCVIAIVKRKSINQNHKTRKEYQAHEATDPKGNQDVTSTVWLMLPDIWQQEATEGESHMYDSLTTLCTRLRTPLAVTLSSAKKQKIGG